MSTFTSKKRVSCLEHDVPSSLASSVSPSLVVRERGSEREERVKGTRGWDRMRDKRMGKSREVWTGRETRGHDMQTDRRMGQGKDKRLGHGKSQEVETRRETRGSDRERNKRI